MNKKPIYGGRIYSYMSNSDITFCGFLKKVVQHQPGLSGAAQNMDLFIHTRPPFTDSFATGGLIIMIKKLQLKGKRFPVDPTPLSVSCLPEIPVTVCKVLQDC